MYLQQESARSLHDYEQGRGCLNECRRGRSGFERCSSRTSTSVREAARPTSSSTSSVTTRPKPIYLVGDIVDGWQLQIGWYWPQSHNDVVQKLLRQARKGVRIVYIPGNHDEFLRDYYGTHFGGIEVVEEAIHVGADGQRYLVIHGDLFDVVVRHARWLALFGDYGLRARDLAQHRISTRCAAGSG